MEHKKLNVRVASDSKDVLEMLRNNAGIFPEIRRRCDEIAEMLTEAGITSLMIMFDALDEEEFIRKISENDPGARILTREEDHKVH